MVGSMNGLPYSQSKRKNPMPQPALSFPAIAAALLVGCGGPPSREEAAALLRPRFMEYGTDDQRTLHRRYGSRIPSNFVMNDRKYKHYSGMDDEVECLTAAGVFDFDTKGKYFKLTPEAGEARISYTGGWNGFVQVSLGMPSFEAITGMTEQEGGTELLVEFSWKYQEYPGPSLSLVESCLPEGVKKILASTHPGTAKLTKYDDGWRVSDIHIDKPDF